MTKQELEWKPAPLYVETMAEVEELKNNKDAMTTINKFVDYIKTPENKAKIDAMMK